MRVLTVGNMYPPHHLGGYELMWRSWVRHARAAGHEVRVLTTDYRSAAPDPALAEDADVHRDLRWYWRDHEFPRLGLRERLRVERHNLATLERHVEELAPDALCWWAMGGMSMSMIEWARRRGLPAAAVVVDEWLLYGPKVDQWQSAARRAGPLRGPLERLTGVPSRLRFDPALRWLFASRTLVEHARGNGWRLPGATVAHAGIDPSLFAPRPSREWRGRLLYLGRLDPRKGIEIAVRALALLEGATLRVVGAGDDAYAERLRALASELRLEGRVSFDRVPRSQVPAAYAEADALVFPVLWEEPWGLVPLEAMASGVPVVATGTGGSGEYLAHEENCLLYSPPDDPGALARALARLAAERELRERLRAGGLATAARHTEEAFNEAVLGALAELA